MDTTTAERGPVGSPETALSSFLAEVKCTLHTHRARMTPARALILGILFTQNAVLSTTDMTLAVHEHDATVDRATVYRCLEFLTDLNIVEKDATRRGAVRYRIARPGSSSSAVHIRCSQCGSVQSLSSRTISAMATSVSRHTQFALAPGGFELPGRCSACAGA